MKKITVINFWTFDILHPWHVFFLEESKKQGDILITIIARDKNVEKLKHKTPINREELRLENIEKLKIADKVELGSEENPLEMLEKYNPDIICLGYDQKGFLDKVYSFLKKRNIKIKRIAPYKETIYKSSLLQNNI